MINELELSALKPSVIIANENISEGTIRYPEKTEHFFVEPLKETRVSMNVRHNPPIKHISSEIDEITEHIKIKMPVINKVSAKKECSLLHLKYITRHIVISMKNSRYECSSVTGISMEI